MSGILLRYFGVLSSHSSLRAEVVPEPLLEPGQSPCASFQLLKTAAAVAESLQLKTHVGGVFSSDAFYDESQAWKRMAAYGTLVAEMETSSLYTLAARHGAEALSILTVSDLIATGEAMTAEQRERHCTAMLDLALEVVAQLADLS